MSHSTLRMRSIAAALVWAIVGTGCGRFVGAGNRGVETRSDIQVDSLSMIRATTQASLDQPISGGPNLGVVADVQHMTLLPEHDHGEHPQMLALNGSHPDSITSSTLSLGASGQITPKINASLGGGGGVSSDGGAVFARGAITFSPTELASVSALATARLQHLRPPEAMVKTPQRWPAWRGGLDASLLGELRPRDFIRMFGGGTLSTDLGELANPYQRAFVQNRYVEEILPNQRLAAMLFAGVSFYVGMGIGLHARQNVYFDNWSVLSFLPEAALSLELLSGDLQFYVRYQYAGQLRADAYASSFQTDELVDGGRTSNARLGSIVQHEGELSARAQLWAASSAAVFVTVGYTMTHTAYIEAAFSVLLHTPALGIEANY